MPPEEEKRQEQFLLLLLALAGTTEGRINRAVRPALVQTMLRIRRAVQTLSPTGQFRVYEWARLSPKILPILETIPKTMLPQLLREVQMLLPSVQEAAADFSARRSNTSRHHPADTAAAVSHTCGSRRGPTVVVDGTTNYQSLHPANGQGAGHARKKHDSC